MSTLLITTIIGILIIWFLNRRLSLLYILIVSLLPTLIGGYELASQGGGTYEAAYEITAGVSFLFLGYLTAQFLSGKRTKGSKSYVLTHQIPSVESSLWPLIAVCALGTIYYFYKPGIARFSSSIEIQRFNFSASGFFGIPGRIYLYGLPLLAGLSLIRAHILGRRWLADRATLAAFSLYLVSRLLSGFKSGLIEVVTTFLLVQISCGALRVTVGASIRRYLPTIIISLVFVVLVANLYSTYTTSGRSITSNLEQRVTTVAAKPTVLVLEHQLAPEPSSSIPIDLHYFLREYAHIGPGSAYSFSQIVSADIQGVNPASSAYVPPVTYGLFSEVGYDYGLKAAYCIMVLCGAIFFYINDRGFKRASVSKILLRLALLLGLFNLITKGGIVYTALNWTLVAIGMAMIFKFLQILSTRRDLIQHIRHLQTTSGPSK